LNEVVSCPRTITENISVKIRTVVFLMFVLFLLLCQWVAYNEQGFVQVGISIPSARNRCSIYKLKFIFLFNC
jgi:hypothetical protein